MSAATALSENGFFRANSSTRFLSSFNSSPFTVRIKWRNAFLMPRANTLFMLLDAQSLEARLTPEVALGIIQKELQRRGWKDFKVHDIRLYYTPYWTFGFDVIADSGATPTGKTALNAFTGELNDFIPMLLDRPINKSRGTMEGAKVEIERTAVSFGEVKGVSATKIAAHVGGLKPEQVTISAVSKVYVPTYRVWVDVAGDSFKFEIDAALGMPTGLEAVPKRQKGWDEATGETLKKMKSPSGWMDLVSHTLGFAGGLAAGAKGEQGKLTRYVVLAGLILVLMWFVFGLSGSGKVDCYLFDDYKTNPAWFGLQPGRVLPEMAGSKYFVRGACDFVNEGGNEEAIVAQVRVVDGNEFILDLEVITAVPPVQTTMPTTKTFELNWTEATQKVAFEFEKL